VDSVIPACEIQIDGVITEENGGGPPAIVAGNFPRGGICEGISGATVSVYGANPPISDTTDACGLFSLTVPPLDEPYVFLQVSPISGASASSSYLGLVKPLFIDSEMMFRSLDLISEELVDQVEAFIQMSQPSFTRNPADGIVSVQFDAVTGDEYQAQGGESIDLSVNSDVSFTFNSSDEPQISSTLLNGGSSDLIFINADVGLAQLTSLASAPLCALSEDITDWPVVANSITDAFVECFECTEFELGNCDDANDCTDSGCSASKTCEFTPKSPGTPCAGGLCDNSGNCIPIGP
jgi:hypothetical protein